MPVDLEPDRLDALVGRLRAAGCVFAEDEAALLVDDANDPAELEALTSFRLLGEPLEVVLGWAEFCGLRIAMEPGVFVPRRRSELLVRTALTALRTPPAARAAGGAWGSAAGAPVVLDLCCGSGAIGAALLAGRPALELWAADLEPASVHCARGNLGDRATVLQGDLFGPLPAHLAGRIDVIVANAPYVPTGAIAFMPAEARDHEPRSALDGGPDGTSIQARIATAAPRWLRPGGSLLIEAGQDQAVFTAAAFEAAGLLTEVLHDDDLDATVVSGRLGVR